MPSKRGKKYQSRKTGRQADAPGDEITEADETTSNEHEEADKDLDAQQEIKRLRLELENLRRQQRTPANRGRGGMRLSSSTGGYGPTSFDSGGYGNRLAAYKTGTLRQLPVDTPAVKAMADIYRLRSSLFNWLGAKSFLLRCADIEQDLQTPEQRHVYEDKWNCFVRDHTPDSMETLQGDLYQILSAHFRNSTVLVQFPDKVSSETLNCATQLWNAVLDKYHPTSPTMRAMVYARVASSLIRGPQEDYNSFDRQVSNAMVDLHEMPTMTSEEFVACMMYAGLSNSSETHWVEAATKVRQHVELQSGTFDLGTIRSFAGAAMPDAAKMYAFSGRVGRVPMIGLDHPAPGCTSCPLGHCQFSDKKFRPPPRSGSTSNSSAAAFTSRILPIVSAPPEDDPYAWYPEVREVSDKTRRVLADLEAATPMAQGAQAAPQYKALVATLKNSLEDDRACHAYNAGGYANRARGRFQPADDDQDEITGWFSPEDGGVSYGPHGTAQPP